MSKNFGEKLKELRLKSNLGFNEFWKLAQISNVYLSSVERGNQIPSPETQIRFLTILESKGKISDLDKSEYYDLASSGRNEIPADILTYYLSNKKISEEFRYIIKRKSNHEEK